MTRLVCISDTHGLQERIELPDGDILIHAGDLTSTGKPDQVEAALAWLAARSRDYRHTIFIAGNHDFLFEQHPDHARYILSRACAGCEIRYLEDSGAEIDLGDDRAPLRLHGSPVSPRFYDWAFNRNRGAEIRAHWDKIPSGLDILITHGPPLGILDRNAAGEATGCEDLLARVQEAKPRVHIFGHIHEGYGVAEQDATTFVNASICDMHYRPVHKPVVVDI